MYISHGSEIGGSSPRIRGKCQDFVHVVFDVGIIPANTGKIRIRSGPAADPRDHPREYGENVFNRFGGVAGFGIIPANTGKINTYRPLRSMIEDHPREYGENRRVEGQE